MDRRTDLLIIGAGPFGLALAADARHRGIDHLVVGKPMEFWKRNMPDGMYLRSDCDWHLDPNGEHTDRALPRHARADARGCRAAVAPVLSRIHRVVPGA